MNELPLLELFTQLQRAGLQLGIDDYEAVLKALQGGYGLVDREALARLCRMLWVRSPYERQLFDYYFQQLFQIELDRNKKKPNYRKRLLMGVIATMAGILCQLDAPKQFQFATSQVLINLPNSIILIFLILTIVGLGFWTTQFFWLQRHHLRLSQQSKRERKIAPEVVCELKDEVQIVQTVQQVNHQVRQSRNSMATSVFLPVTQRQMKQSWRYLRQWKRQGVTTNLDLEATIAHIARTGFLVGPILAPLKANRTELILLIDSDGSMVAFRSLSERLIETALRGGRLGKTGIYYFHNCPISFLYRDAFHVEVETVQAVLNRFRRDHTVVLIFSDAGAARGGYSLDRIAAMKEFLERLKRQTKQVTWLNPMPKSRWFGTSAAEIAHFVPMFETTRQGLEGAIAVLRGKHHSIVEILGDRR